MARVIAIAGPPGSGKSTLAHALATELGRAVVLEFDRYEQATTRSIEEIAQWLKAGGDFDALGAPRLRDDLDRLVAEPAYDYVILEMPLGRAYRATAPLIDLLVWIDLPPDVALARKLHQITTNILQSSNPLTALSWLHGYTDAYLKVVHRVLALQRERVRPDADFCINGFATCAEIAHALRLHLAGNPSA